MENEPVEKPLSVEEANKMSNISSKRKLYQDIKNFFRPTYNRSNSLNTIREIDAPNSSTSSSSEGDVFHDYDFFKKVCKRKMHTITEIEEFNDVSSWNLSSARNRQRGSFTLRSDRLLRCRHYSLELHEGITEDEKSILCNTRFKRRGAIQINKKEELNTVLFSYVTMKRLNSMFNI